MHFIDGQFKTNLASAYPSLFRGSHLFHRIFFKRKIQNKYCLLFSSVITESSLVDLNLGLWTTSNVSRTSLVTCQNYILNCCSFPEAVCFFPSSDNGPLYFNSGTALLLVTWPCFVFRPSASVIQREGVYTHTLPHTHTHTYITHTRTRTAYIYRGHLLDRAEGINCANTCCFIQHCVRV